MRLGQTGAKVRSVGELQDIDELCVVEVRASVKQCSPLLLAHRPVVYLALQDACCRQMCSSRSAWSQWRRVVSQSAAPHRMWCMPAVRALARNCPGCATIESAPQCDTRGTPGTLYACCWRPRRPPRMRFMAVVPAATATLSRSACPTATGPAARRSSRRAARDWGLPHR
jgi:hypothetical protein